MIIIGCGLHYQSKYHSVLETKGVKIALLIDLKVNEEAIRAFFQNRTLKPQRFLFLDEVHRNAVTVEKIESWVAEIDLSGVKKVLISTEPKARKAYAIWAARRGFDLFLDKPVTAFLSGDQSDTLLSDFEEIERAGVRVVVSCERRAHLGYLWLKKYIDEQKIPLTGIDIHFAGGVWKTLQEYREVENHPFHYGYGILLHSGYHYVDLLVSLLSYNQSLIGKTSESLYALASSPGVSTDEAERFGEADFLMIGQSLKEGRAMVNFSMQLFGTSVSRRRSIEGGAKLEGRLRQEKVTLHFGHLCSIHVSSQPFKKLKDSPYEDFSVTIMNSPLLKGKQAVIRLDRKQISEMFPELPLEVTMNSFARQWQLSEFLEGRDGNSPLGSHRDTVAMLQKIYSTLRRPFPPRGGNQDDLLESRLLPFSMSQGRVSGI